MALAKIVVALGGNALQRKGTPATAEAQLAVVKETVEYIAEMSCRDYELAIVHGNGPQVGNIVLASETAADVVPVMPFDVCGAMSQGYIGYHIQQALRFSLKKRCRDIPVATIITQVVVDENDPAFQNPSKPIGPFYSEEEALEINREKGYAVKEDAGRGWRRVVASPMPKKIVEFSCLKELWDTTIVITAGGGGIPVIENEDGSLEGIAAVIDKDLAAARLADDIEADILMILTEVEKVALNFNKPDQKDLDRVTVEEAEKYIAEGHFAPGSMLPKIQAAVMFVRENPGKKAIITSLFKSLEALDGKTGTLIE
ncbi:MAG TPA: carbamate kinase [Firmicutes bacterium]|nr:carbamate kinase [Bacillota bacterium]